jgi:glycosyltransferase involved in cell wall biosynthesis
MLTTTREPSSAHCVRTGAAAEPLQRVLYAIVLDPGQKFGSLEEQIYFLARAFQARGSLFLPLFLCPPAPGKTRQFEERGVAAECLDLRRFRPTTLWRLVRLIGRHGIDVVHWNFSQPIGNAYVWWLTLLRPGVKHYFTDHNSRSGPAPGPRRGVRRLVKKALLRRYRRVVCVSRFVQECLERDRSWSNLLCLLHFINTDRFRPDGDARAELRRRLGAEDSFVLMAVAHLIKEKGIDVALRALAELPPAVTLWVAGDGREADALRGLRDELGLGERVRFLGLQGDVAPYMQAADCLVCPSLWAEAAGLVNLEGLACGLPVIASRIGGIPEYVDDGETGLLFEPGDARRLAECVRRLHDDPDTYRRMSDAARARAVERFSVERRIDEYLDLYRK